MEFMDGLTIFLARLETIFTFGANPDNPSGIIFDSTNES